MVGCTLLVGFKNVNKPAILYWTGRLNCPWNGRASHSGSLEEFYQATTLTLKVILVYCEIMIQFTFYVDHKRIF